MIATPLTEMFGLQHPIVLAPMGGVSGGALAAAVSNAGGLGLVGGGYGDAAWLETELGHVARTTTRPLTCDDHAPRNGHQRQISQHFDDLEARPTSRVVLL